MLLLANPDKYQATTEQLEAVRNFLIFLLLLRKIRQKIHKIQTKKQTNKQTTLKFEKVCSMGFGHALSAAALLKTEFNVDQATEVSCCLFVVVCLFVCLFGCLGVCLFWFCLFVCLFVRLFVCLFVCLFVFDS
jgi:hypothetical protein